MKIRYLGLS